MGPLGAGAVVAAQVRELHGATQRKLLHLSHDWLTSFMPHVLAKINRVSFGLLTAEDLPRVDQNMPNSRRLMAVPFVGKDCPSHASEFSHPDILIGLTVLAYRYEGCRRSDVRRVVATLQRQMRNQVGPFSARPASLLFESWATKGRKWAQSLFDKQQADEEAEARRAAEEEAAEAGADATMADSGSSPHAATASSSSSSIPATTPRSSESSRRQLHLPPIVPLSIFQLSDRSRIFSKAWLTFPRGELLLD